MQRKHVAIIGANFAGITAVQAIQATAEGAIDITLIDPSNTSVWTPHIHEVLSGVKTEQDVCFSRDKLLGNNVSAVQGRVTALDAHNRLLSFVNPHHEAQNLHFDACLVACGYAPVATQKPNQFSFGSVQDALAIKIAIQQRIANKEHTNITIVGGGFTGIEVLGELLRQHKNSSLINVQVIESGPRLISGLPSVVSDDISRLCDSNGIEVHLNAKVESSDAQGLQLSNGCQVKSDICIFTSGGVLPEFIKGLALPDDNTKGIYCFDTLQHADYPHVFAAGDISTVQIDGQRVAKQAWSAQQQGACAGRNIVRWLQGKTMESFQPRIKPVLLSFGNINTYLIAGQTVYASPLLASVKETLFQVSMAKQNRYNTLAEQKHGLLRRFTRSVTGLLLPEIRPSSLVNLIANSRLLQKGESRDITMLVDSINDLVRR